MKFLYIISELVQIRIQKLCASHTWTLQSYPEKISLPRELFASLSHAEQQLVIKTKYFQEDLLVSAKRERTNSGESIKAETRKLSHRISRAHLTRTPTKRKKVQKDATDDEESEESESSD
jgi:sister-chromatid-cohesion protein PDS5